ncbi:MAG: extracellular solute-binding protein [Oscillospiraceae bacterium]|nr:extracellular solute-binding protein [Oscillospiraceae bacterium]
MVKIKNQIKKICAFCLACTFPVTLLSCSEKKTVSLPGQPSETEQSVTEQIITDAPAKPQKLTRFFDQVELKSGNPISDDFRIIGNTTDSIYCMSYSSADMCSYKTCCTNSDDPSHSGAASVVPDNREREIVQVDKEGTVINTYTASDCTDEGGRPYDIKILPIDENNLYYMVTKCGVSPDEDEHGISSYCVYKAGAQSQSVKIFDSQTFDYNYIPQSFCIDKNGKILIPMMDFTTNHTGIYVYGSDPVPEYTIECPDDNAEITYIFTGADNSLYCIERHESKLYRIDTQKGELTEVSDFTAASENTFYKGSCGYDFYYQNKYGIMGYSIPNGKSDQIFMNMDCDCDTFPSTAAVLSPELIIAVNNNFSDTNCRLCKYVKADQERLDELNSKQIIRLAGCLDDLSVTLMIQKFNSENDDYRIAATDYSAYSSSYDTNNITAGIKCDSDILSGDIPDILLPDSTMDIPAYLSKGLLADMNSFIDSDAQFNRDDYYSSILDAYTYKEKLFLLPVKYSSATYAVKTSYWGERDKWTYDEFFSFASEHPDIQPFDSDYRYMIFMSLMESYAYDHVNFDEHSCDFDNDTFEKILQFINDDTIPSEQEKSAEWTDFTYALKNDMSLMRYIYMNDIYGLHRMINLYAGENVSLPGIPSDSGIHRTVEPGLSFSVTENSDVKEGAWMFIRQFLTDEYQDGIIINDLPLKKSSLYKRTNQLCNDETLRETYDENGNPYTLPAVNLAERESFRNFMESPARSAICFHKIMIIINEESEIFFSSGCTAREAAVSIQNKVSRYLNEML